MSIKFADEIIEEIKERGQIQVPDGCAVGEEFEKWLRGKNHNGFEIGEWANYQEKS